MPASNPAVLRLGQTPLRGVALMEQPGVSAPAAWCLDVLQGRFVEISGGPATAGLSICARLIVEAQQAGGLAAWVGTVASSFYPPDFAASGVDLAALPVVRLADVRQVWQACDALLRSGGFSLVVADLPGGITLPLSAQSRLSGLAQHYRVVLVALTRIERGDVPRSSLVSLRVETRKVRTGHDCFACGLHISKDKRHPPGTLHEEFRRGTDGLC